MVNELTIARGLVKVARSLLYAGRNFWSNGEFESVRIRNLTSPKESNVLRLVLEPKPGDKWDSHSIDRLAFRLREGLGHFLDRRGITLSWRKNIEIEIKTDDVKGDLRKAVDKIEGILRYCSDSDDHGI